MNTQEAFKLLLKDKLALILKQHNFSRSGNTFYHLHEKNWGLISFQKSRSNTSDFVKFTINVGIYSDKVSIFLTPNRWLPPRYKPSLWDCCLGKRIGDLLPEQQDKWWIIEGRTDRKIKVLIDEVGAAIQEVAVPFIKKYILDEALRDYFLSNEQMRRTNEATRLIFAAILVKTIGPQAMFPAILEQLEALVDDPQYIPGYIAEHVEKLRTREII